MNLLPTDQRPSYSMPLILPLSELSDLKQTEYLRALSGGVMEEVLLLLAVLSSVYKYLYKYHA